MTDTADLAPLAPHHQDGEPSAQLRQLYHDMDATSLAPLWTQREDLMPFTPQPAAIPTAWRWAALYDIASRSGELVPVGRGGERRAIALKNPGLAPEAFATPTLWAAIQFLGPHETAPSHRHSQNAFRFVVEGDGVWTNVEGDAVAMTEGDLLLTPGWQLHEHHNTTDHPMAWIDGLDAPLACALDAGFFEFGSTTLSTIATPARSRGERLWANPGLLPLVSVDSPFSPLAAYRWAHTDAALREQLACADEGQSLLPEPGHAAVRFSNPATGGDVLPTIRAEMHRLAPGTRTRTQRVVGSAVWQVFGGAASVRVGTETWELSKGDLFAVPSWAPLTVTTSDGADFFRFSDEPVYEALGFMRRQWDEQ
jgi:gentisate 1,2-dioxygenase